MGSAAIAACAWCGWVSGFHRTSVAAELTWLLTLGAVLLFDLALWRGRTSRQWGVHLQPADHPWPRQGRGGSGPAFRGAAPWIALVLAAVAWDVLGIDTGPHQYHLTISALAQAYRPLNAVVLLAWILVGIGYQAARVRAPAHETGAISENSGPETPEHRTAFAAAVGSLGPHPSSPGLLLPQSPSLGIAFWVAVPVVAVLIEMAARRSRGRTATAQEFVRFVSTSRFARLPLVAAWVLGGYHLFAR
jgi:hypothetical protein